MSEEKNKDIRNTSLDILRIIAIYTVILLHVLGTQFWKVNVNSVWWKKLNLIDSGTRWCVPVFVMISGALFLDTRKKITLKKTYSKYILHIIKAFLFWSILYTTVDLINSQYIVKMTFKQTVAEFIVRTLLKPHYHLWYMYLIVGLYMATPILKIIIKNIELSTLQYWILLMFILGICLGFVNDFEKVNFYIKEVVENTNIQFWGGYTFYFVMGYYISNQNIEQRYYTGIYLIGIMGYIFTVIITYLVSYKSNTNAVMYNYLYPNIASMSVAIFTFFVKKINKINISDNCREMLGKFSEMMFGVYLIHDLFIMLFQKCGFLIESIHSIIWAVVVSAIILVVSSICVWGLRKVSVLRNVT